MVVTFGLKVSLAKEAALHLAYLKKINMYRQGIKFSILTYLLFCSVFLFAFDNTDSLNILLKSASGSEKSLILYELSQSYLTGDLNKSMEYAEECLSFSKKIEFKIGEAKALKSMGMIYHLKGNYSLSTEFLLKANILMEELNEKEETANIAIKIGNSYFQQRQFDLAFQYYLKAKEISEEINADKIYAKAMNSIFGNLGIVLSNS